LEPLNVEFEHDEVIKTYFNKAALKSLKSSGNYKLRLDVNDILVWLMEHEKIYSKAQELSNFIKHN